MATKTKDYDRTIDRYKVDQMYDEDQHDPEDFDRIEDRNLTGKTCMACGWTTWIGVPGSSYDGQQERKRCAHAPSEDDPLDRYKSGGKTAREKLGLKPKDDESWIPVDATPKQREALKELREVMVECNHSPDLETAKCDRDGVTVHLTCAACGDSWGWDDDGENSWGRGADCVEAEIEFRVDVRWTEERQCYGTAYVIAPNEEVAADIAIERVNEGEVEVDDEEWYSGPGHIEIDYVERD